jgi:hypothetical protein
MSSGVGRGGRWALEVPLGTKGVASAPVTSSRTLPICTFLTHVHSLNADNTHTHVCVRNHMCTCACACARTHM